MSALVLLPSVSLAGLWKEQITVYEQVLEGSVLNPRAFAEYVVDEKQGIASIEVEVIRQVNRLGEPRFESEVHNVRIPGLKYNLGTGEILYKGVACAVRTFIGFESLNCTLSAYVYGNTAKAWLSLPY